jgi:hypothetical protein
MLAWPATAAQATFEPDDEDAPEDDEPEDPEDPEDDDEPEDEDAAAAAFPAFLSPDDDPPLSPDDDPPSLPDPDEPDEPDESGPDEDEPDSDPFSALSFAVFSFVAVALALARESVR